MQKEETVVVVLLFMALGSMALGSMALGSMALGSMALGSMALGSMAVASWALGDFDEDPGPASIVAEGTVSSIQLTSGGHLTLRLYSSTMPIFVSRESGAEEVAKRVAKGDRIRVRGEIAEYAGRREIVVQRSEDVEVP